MHIDLHNHTTLCNHATGTMDEYIQKAISEGIEVFGFSCHAPMAFDEKYRMSLADLPNYCADIKALQATYADKITILSALEVDYILNKPELIEEAVKSYPFDYLIGSVHFLDNWGFDNPAFLAEWAKRDMDKCWSEYLEAISQMAQSGLFQIVGHFDLLKLFGYAPSLEQEDNINKALQAIADNHLSLELNPRGWKKPINQAYPSLEILQKARAKGISITFGSDAHGIDEIGFAYPHLCALAQSAGYTEVVYYQNKEPISTKF